MKFIYFFFCICKLKYNETAMCCDNMANMCKTEQRSIIRKKDALPIHRTTCFKKKYCSLVLVSFNPSSIDCLIL